jgi:hypothetical protein
MATCYFHQAKKCNSTSTADMSGQLVSPTFVPWSVQFDGYNQAISEHK